MQLDEIIRREQEFHDAGVATLLAGVSICAKVVRKVAPDECVEVGNNDEAPFGVLFQKYMG